MHQHIPNITGVSTVTAVYIIIIAGLQLIIVV